MHAWLFASLCKSGLELGWALLVQRIYLLNSLSNQLEMASYLWRAHEGRLGTGHADSIPFLAKIVLCSHGESEKIESDTHLDVVRSRWQQRHSVSQPPSHHLPAWRICDSWSLKRICFWTALGLGADMICSCFCKWLAWQWRKMLVPFPPGGGTKLMCLKLHLAGEPVSPDASGLLDLVGKL